jgi:NADPH-dependent 2,4-dienoyl-CoA reductase/sulfur reductase-like enzyme
VSRILVVGGNAAGMTAASRAKRLDPSLEITILEASSRIAYSICGLPYFLSGLVRDLSELELYSPESLMNERGIEARVQCRVVELRALQRKIVVEHAHPARRDTLSYDKLLIATGYRPITPDIDGVHVNGVFTASRLGDADAIASWLSSKRARRAVVIGGGYVGLEVAEAMVARGLTVTLVDAATQIFSTLDPDMAKLVEDELSLHGVHVMTHRRARRIAAKRDGDVDAVELAAGSLRIPGDLVFIDVGVVPSVELAANAGVALGPTGAIAVNDRLETNLPGVYAAGNCAETHHLVTERPSFIPLGTVAAKQGRVAGENLAGRRSRFIGAVGTSIVKVFDIVAAKTGLNVREAEHAGFSPIVSTVVARARAHYFGGAPASVKVIADRDSERLLGAQIVGSARAASAIDVAAAALTARMTVREASQLDLAYAPPAGALWNPLLVALNTLTRELER